MPATAGGAASRIVGKARNSKTVSDVTLRAVGLQKVRRHPVACSDGESHFRLPSKTSTANNATSSKTPFGSTSVTAPSVHIHWPTDSALQSDQRKQNTAKVRNVRSPVATLQLADLRAAACLRRNSRTAPTTTSTPSSPQNKMSCAVTGKPPRSQNHWYECNSQVAANTAAVETTTAATGPSRFT